MSYVTGPCCLPRPAQSERLTDIADKAAAEAAANTQRIARQQMVAACLGVAFLVFMFGSACALLALSRYENTRHPMQSYTVNMIRPDGIVQAKLPVLSRCRPFSYGGQILRHDVDGYKEVVTTLPVGWWFHVTDNSTPEKEPE